MKGVKIAKETYCALLNIAPATPRSEDGNHAANILPQDGPTGVSKAPKQTLKNINKLNVKKNHPLNPITKVASDHSTTPIAIDFLEPILSASHPAGTCPSA